MNIDWVFAPLTQTAFVGVGMVGSMALWISAKMDTRTRERERQKEFDAFRAATKVSLDELTAKINELQTAPVPPPAIVQGLNLTTRTKALRMHRRGEPLSSIAAALGVQQEEVNLLLKLDRLLEPRLA